MRMIDLDDGQTLQAANDEELFRIVRENVSESEKSDEEIHGLIAERAYEATDS